MSHTIVPVILSGGAGSRLWPLSRSNFPKQFLEAPNGRTFLHNTLLRATAINPGNVIVACNDIHRFTILQQASELDIAPASVLVEPSLRDTGPAIALVAHHAAKTLGEDAVILIMPSDHLIDEQEAFIAAVQSALPLTEHHIVTFGITPTFPATGYGYIHAGEAQGPGYKVNRFVEKPDAQKAEALIASGDHYWNAGIFMFKPRVFLAKLTKVHAELASTSQKAAEMMKHDGMFTRTDKEAYEACPKISIDYAVMEKADNLAVVPYAGSWTDIGNWDAMWEQTAKDNSQNAVVGNATLTNCTGCYVHSAGKSKIVAHGLTDQAIIHTADATLVIPRSQAADVKDIYKALESAKDPLASTHVTDYRPWGGYTVLADEATFKAKHLWVSPGGRLSLQSHKHRAEHWVVIEGTATVTRNEETLTVERSQSVFLPLGCKHKLENLTDKPLHIVEVQTGDYFGEDDIVRYDDIYGRTNA